MWQQVTEYANALILNIIITSKINSDVFHKNIQITLLAFAVVGTKDDIFKVISDICQWAANIIVMMVINYTS